MKRFTPFVLAGLAAFGVAGSGLVAVNAKPVEVGDRELSLTLLAVDLVRDHEERLAAAAAAVAGQ